MSKNDSYARYMYNCFTYYIVQCCSQYIMYHTPLDCEHCWVLHTVHLGPLQEFGQKYSDLLPPSLVEHLPLFWHGLSVQWSSSLGACWTRMHANDLQAAVSSNERRTHKQEKSALLLLPVCMFLHSDRGFQQRRHICAPEHTYHKQSSVSTKLIRT